MNVPSVNQVRKWNGKIELGTLTVQGQGKKKKNHNRPPKIRLKGKKYRFRGPRDQQVIRSGGSTLDIGRTIVPPSS